MAATLLATASAEGAGGPSTTSAVDTTGATLFVARLSDTGGSPGISDSESNTWTDTGKRVYICENPTTSASHTFTIAAGSYQAITVAAFDGTDTGGATDQTATQATGTGTTATSNTTGTTATANELVVGFFQGAGATLTPGTGYTLAVSQGYVYDNAVNGIIYKNVTSTGTFSADATLDSGDWVADIYTFKEAGGGGGATPRANLPLLGAGR